MQLTDYSDHMSFTQRLHNTLISLSDWMVRRWIHLPNQQKIAQQYFGHLDELPSMDDFVKNVSAILINLHQFFMVPRPSMPSIAFIGGSHIEEPNPLPDDLQTFLDEAIDGAIFFSFGTFIKSEEMPAERLQVFLGALSQIKQRVIWKFDQKFIENIPTNVIARERLPQNDILAHPNVVLFISHGE